MNHFHQIAALLDSYGKAVDFIDLDTLAPIQTWLEKG